jgi:hypothetical protein
LAIILVNSNQPAASLEQDCIAPHIVEFSDPFAPTHFAKAAALVQGDARSIRGKRYRLQSPNAVRFGRRYQRIE